MKLKKLAWLFSIGTFVGICISIVQTSFTNNAGPNQNKAISKMTYGRFLEYLDMGWIKTLDFYENGRIAIIEASSPELSDRIQKIRVEIPVGASPLISKLREAKVDFTSHPTANYDGLLTLLSNIFIPFVIILGLFLLFRSTTNFLGGPGQLINFRKAKADVQPNTGFPISFQDVAGIDEAKEEVEEIVAFLKNPERFSALGAKIPKGVLLVGPPGTGKTLIAKAIASEAKVDFRSISGSEFVEMFVGVGASRVRDLFKAAQEKAPCIVFIDEIDAVGRKRGAGVGGGNDEREQTLNQLLTEMDGFRENTGVLVLAATNRVDVLDDALLRPGRFDRQINVNLPDIKGRYEILKVHARNKKLSENANLYLIAQRTPGFSGADLANLLNEAAIIGVRTNKTEITDVELNAALDRIIIGIEGKRLSHSQSKLLLAYHEVGHAIIATLLKDHEEVQKVTLIPRGQVQGFTWFTPNEKNQALISRRQLLNKITVSLGGRAAEQIVFGPTEVTTGASSDLQEATHIARQMVTRFGMSPIGPRSLEPSGSQVFLDQEGSEISNSLADKIDHEIRAIVESCYTQAIQIIIKNRQLINVLVTLLVEKETLEGFEFREIVAKYKTSEKT